MRLSKVYLSDSPYGKDKVRLNGEVVYDSCAGETYWFDFPREYEQDISLSGNAWLTCLLPLAMKMGEPLVISHPVDQTRLINAIELRNIWASWYPGLKRIEIFAENRQDQRSVKPGKTVAFFSGGVDSFFTILRQEKGSRLPTHGQIDDLLSVWGTDIPIENQGDFNVMRDSLKEAAGALGKEFIDIATNARQTKLELAGWARVYFSSLYVAIAFLLEKRYSKVMFSSGGEECNILRPWGSHPITDPLLSSSSMQVFHDGVGFSRVERTRFIAGNDLARRKLRVCWRKRSAGNCGNCEKCYRTMITLFLLDELNNFQVFQNELDLKRISKIYIPNPVVQGLYGQIINLAYEKGRVDIAESIKRSLRFSNSLQIFRFVRPVRGLGRLEAAFQRWMTRDHLV